MNDNKYIFNKITKRKRDEFYIFVKKIRKRSSKR